MILADVEIHRFGLQDAMLALAESAGLPIATTILGKSVISEAHPLFVGMYEGAMGKEEITRYVEEWLKARRLRIDDAARAHVHHAIVRYAWKGPLRKIDVDPYLDASINKAELAVPEGMQKARG